VQQAGLGGRVVPGIAPGVVKSEILNPEGAASGAECSKVDRDVSSVPLHSFSPRDRRRFTLVYRCSSISATVPNGSTERAPSWPGWRHHISFWNRSFGSGRQGLCGMRLTVELPIAGLWMNLTPVFTTLFCACGSMSQRHGSIDRRERGSLPAGQWQIPDANRTDQTNKTDCIDWTDRTANISIVQSRTFAGSPGPSEGRGFDARVQSGQETFPAFPKNPIF
jgi:hypothetical protein